MFSAAPADEGEGVGEGGTSKEGENGEGERESVRRIGEGRKEDVLNKRGCSLPGVPRLPS